MSWDEAAGAAAGPGAGGAAFTATALEAGPALGAPNGSLKSGEAGHRVAWKVEIPSTRGRRPAQERDGDQEEDDHARRPAAPRHRRGGAVAGAGCGAGCAAGRRLRRRGGRTGGCVAAAGGAESPADTHRLCRPAGSSGFMSRFA